MAVAISWKGYVDTDMSFTEFFAKDHTLMLRFMLQYPNAYNGPFVAENGTGTYAVGLGDFSSGSPNLFIQVGLQVQTYEPTLIAGAWYHLAVVATASGSQMSFTLYLDGQKIDTPLGNFNPAQRPIGKLRFGRRTDGKMLQSQTPQFYGLLDDVAIFTKALSASDIQALKHRQHLAGSEAALLAGWNFNHGKQPAKLARPISMRGAAQQVTASADRNNADDAKLLPLPTEQQLMDLPFPAGEAWSVLQGYDNPTGTHHGYGSFCWDFTIAGYPLTGKYPSGSDGAPFYAAAPGKVVTVKQNLTSGQQIVNLVEVQQASEEICAYLHLRRNSANVKVGDEVVREQQLALTGDVGAKVGANHLHLAATDKPDQTPGFVTFPVAFSDYEVLGKDKQWHTVSRGVPKVNETLRIPPTPRFLPISMQTHNAVNRGKDRLDIAVADVNGRVWSSRWSHNANAQHWDRWRSLLDGITYPNTPVTLSSRSVDRLDAFAVGQDCGVWTASRAENTGNGQWHGWQRVLDKLAAPNSAVCAVARGPFKLDIFIIGADGGIYTAALNINQWRGWQRVLDGVASPNSALAAVSRSPDKLDVFCVAPDGSIWTASRDGDFGQWHGWWRIRDGVAAHGTGVTVVSRGPDNLEVFIIGTDGAILAAGWDQNVDKGEWLGWGRILDGIASLDTSVSAVSRAPNLIDLFVAGTDGGVYTASWDDNDPKRAWRGWSAIGDATAAPDSAISVVSRDPNKLDLFIVNTDGVVYTAARDENQANGEWRGWWPITS